MQQTPKRSCPTVSPALARLPPRCRRSRLVTGLTRLRSPSCQLRAPQRAWRCPLLPAEPEDRRSANAEASASWSKRASSPLCETSASLLSHRPVADIVPPRSSGDIAVQRTGGRGTRRRADPPVLPVGVAAERATDLALAVLSAERERSEGRSVIERAYCHATPSTSPCRVHLAHLAATCHSRGHSRRWV